MKNAARTTVFRYVGMFAGLAALVETGKSLHLNATAVALMMLLGVLFASTYWGLRYALALSVAATAAFNFFFLPPFFTFTISDPQNWFALAAFLVTAMVAGNLSERARREADHAKNRRREVERLYAFSQRLLTTENLVSLMNQLPAAITDTFTISGSAMLLTGSATIYRSEPDISFDEEMLRTVAARGELVMQNSGPSYVPVRVGAKTIGALALVGTTVSRESLEAIGSLAGLSIERARAVEQLSIHRAAQENEKLRTALLDNVTHEFRTPLTSIKASVTSLLSTGPLTGEQRNELLTIIDEESDRLNRLVGEATEMAQLDAGLVKLDLQPCDIADAIQAALERARQPLQKHPLELSLPDGLPQVRIDMERIQEVITHLLENAAKYSQPGTKITVSAERQGTSVAVNVADQGPGIDSFEQPLIFEKFYRGRGQQYASHGTGMGLAIAKVIVDAHGGRIALVSQPGSGSVFTVLLPIPA